MARNGTTYIHTARPNLIMEVMTAQEPKRLAKKCFMIRAGHSPGEAVLSILARDAENKVSKFSPQNISNTLHGFAKLESHPGNLMDIIADEVLRKVEGFSPQVIASVFHYVNSRLMHSCCNFYCDAAQW